VLLLLGALYVGNSYAFIASLQVVPISLASIVAYLYPAMVAVMATRFLRRLEGRRAWIAMASDSGLFCEGDHLAPVVMVSQPSRLRVYSVAHDGDAYLIWPPPGHGDRVDGRLSLGRVDLVALPEEGDERLLAVAAPAAGNLGVTDAWEGFCRVPGEFSEALYPSGAAVGTRTFTVLPPGSGECAAGTPQGEIVKAALALLMARTSRCFSPSDDRAVIMI